MKEINILRLLLVLAIVLGHSPLHESSFLGQEEILHGPVYTYLTTHCIWNEIALLPLFFVSGYLYFWNVKGSEWGGGTL